MTRFRILSILALTMAVASAQTVVFTDSMNAFPAGWTLQRLSGSYDWARMTSRSHSPTSSAKCSNNAGTYFANQHNAFKQPVGLSGYNYALISFWCWYLTETGYDSVMLDLHASGGAWSRVWARTGNYATWESVTVTVPINTDSIRFRFKSDAQTQYEGVYIDDVTLTGYVVDVGIDSVVAPRGVLDTATAVFPSCFVRNNAPVALSYWTICRIPPLYLDSAYVSNHAGLTGRRIYFPQWLAAPRGQLAVRCSTALAGDAVRANDAEGNTVLIKVPDVSCAAITSPVADLDSGYGVTPQALITNPGTEPATFDVVMKLGTFYSDMQAVSLAPGESTVITFASELVTAPRGPCTVRCSTQLTGDRNPTNNASSVVLTVLVPDVGASMILSPTGPIDSGVTVTPQARIVNFGNLPEEFDCRFSIGSAYTDTQHVTDLQPGGYQDITFREWQTMPGTFALSCSTLLGADRVKSNNAARSQLIVRYLDAGISRILSPHTQILPGSVVPRVEVRNNGNITATNVSVTLAINPAGYSRTIARTLAPAVTDTFVFPAWNAALGNFTAAATLTLAGDMNPANDTLRKTVVVGGAHHDAGVNAILSPGSVADPGNVVPRVRVFNYGSVTETNLPVIVRVDLATDLVFADTELVPSIGPGEERDVTFRNWFAYAGDFTVKSWTRQAGDEQAANDTVSRPVLVALHNAGAVGIAWPIDSVGSGFPLAPRILVRNLGTVADSFPVHLLIERLSVTVYEDSARCLVLPGETTMVTLPEWTPTVAGGHQTTAWTRLPGDYYSPDDTLWEAFTVADPVVDVGAVATVVPSGLAQPGSNSPEVKVAGYGNVQSSFWARLAITGPNGAVYVESTWVSLLSSGETVAVRLPGWDAPSGSYRTELVTSCAGDAVFANDTVVGGVDIRASGHWVEKQNVPLLPGGKPVGKGGSLAVMDGPDRVYALKGNRMSDFYSYGNTETAWDTLNPIPDGVERKKPGDGASLTGGGDRFIYATKGNNTRGFWLYDLAADSWHQLPEVPMGVTNKKVKGGTSLAFASRGDTDYVYLLKGYRNEFYRFNTRTASWSALRPAPVGVSVKWDKGSWMVYDGSNNIYAHKAKYHEFWKYDLAADSWLAAPLTPMPRFGSGGSKKAKDGSCATWGGSVIYALKGGNTQEFWCYLPYTNAWTELDTLPRFGSTMKSKRVKTGAALAFLNDRVWALKGNKTREFWCYQPDSALLKRAGREGVQAERLAIGEWRMAITPNPATRGFAVISFTGPPDHLTTGALISVIDIAGRSVHSSFVTRNSTFRLDLRSMPAGIYFVRLASADKLLTRKLVIE